MAGRRLVGDGHSIPEIPPEIIRAAANLRHKWDRVIRREIGKSEQSTDGRDSIHRRIKFVSSDVELGDAITVAVQRTQIAGEIVSDDGTQVGARINAW